MPALALDVPLSNPIGVYRDVLADRAIDVDRCCSIAAMCSPTGVRMTCWS